MSEQNTPKEIIPSTEESTDENEQTQQEVEPTLPSLDDLDDLIQAADSTIATASMSSQEIDELVEKRQKALELLSGTQEFYETGTQFAENYSSPFAGDILEYKTLVREGIISEDYAKKLTQLNLKIQKLQAIKYPDAGTTDALAQLEAQKAKIDESLDLLVDEEEAQTEERRERLRNAISSYYSERAGELEDIVKEIEANPKVAERLEQMEEKHQHELEEQKQQTIKEVAQTIQSMADRANNAFGRISQLIESENIEEELLKALGSSDKKVFNSVRDRLINAILSGEGEMQLANASEITPWGAKGSRYSQQKDFLISAEITAMLEKMAEEGDEKAQQLLEQRSRVTNQDTIFRMLVGRVYKDKDKKQKMPFWKAFDTRRKKDGASITDAKKETEKDVRIESEKFNKEAKKIVEQGGFLVSVPVYSRIRGRTRVIGHKPGAVRLKKIVTEKGTQLFEVDQTFGAAAVLEMGRKSPLNLRGFPAWVREGAELLYIKHGDDFDEILTYAPEEVE